MRYILTAVYTHSYRANGQSCIIVVTIIIIELWKKKIIIIISLCQTQLSFTREFLQITRISFRFESHGARRMSTKLIPVYVYIYIYLVINQNFYNQKRTEIKYGTLRKLLFHTADVCYFVVIGMFRVVITEKERLNLR